MMFGISQMYAQRNYHIKNYGITDELKVRGKTCIVQFNGFIWLGTSNGLMAFDGKYAPLYAIPDKEGRGGYYSRVTTITWQKEGNVLWVGTKRGIFIFDLSMERMQEFKAEGMPEFPNVTCIQFDREGRLWAIMDRQAYMIDVQKKKAECISNGLVSLSCLLVARNGAVWMADYDGLLYRYDVPNRRLRSYDVRPDGVEQFRDIVSITEMKDGQLALTSTADGVCLFSPEKFTSRMLLTHDDEGLPLAAHTAITTRGEDLWIGTERGIVVYQLKDNQITGIRQTSQQLNTLSDNAVHSLCYDEEDGVWAGTFFGGINRVSLSPQNFSVFTPEDEREDVGVVREICGDAQGKLWVGTEDGSLYQFDRNTNTLRLAEVAWGEHPLPFNIQSVLMVGDDLWLSSLGSGIYVIDTKSLRVKQRYTRTNKTDMSQPISGCSLCYQDGDLFLGSAWGVYLYDKTEDAFHLLPELSGIYAHHLYADRHGQVWVATFDNGLWKIQRKGGEWVGKKTPFTYQSTTVIFEDSQGTYWVGTDKEGLMRYDDKTGKSEYLEVSERLRHQSVNNIIEDNRHHLWLNTFDGLYCYNLKKGFIRHFTTSNGLPTDYLNYAAGFKDKDGTLYIGSYKGLVRFNPATFVISRKRLKPYFLNLYVNGKHVIPGDKTGILQQTLYLTKEITLSYDQNTFALNYAVPTYKPGEVVWFRYRFNPEEPWVVTDDPAALQMNNLSPGKYEIALQASYNPDVWEGDVAVLYVTVAPPGWFSPAALLGYVFLIVMVVVIVMSLARKGGEKKD